MAMILDLPATSVSEDKNAWFTPAKYVEAAREVMGGIDLDPASCELANRIVKATRYYTKEENGLMQPWHGRIWCNPPYSSPLSTPGLMSPKQKGLTSLFVQKLLATFRSDEVSQAIVCVNADTNRLWFQALWDYPICFSSRSIAFLRPDGTWKDHFFGTAFAYLGPNEQKFIDVFSKFGTIAKRVSTPRHQVRQASLWERPS